MDNQGRVLLPQILRGKAVLDAEVVVLGKGNYLEVVNQTNFEQQLAASPMTDEDFEKLASIMKPQTNG
jgi:DNA-binding transcriptional regulator/RsmH inhibitor MraZ